jgi:hypothetical protein
MLRLYAIVLLLCLGLTSCLEYYDESTLITDDAGYVHRTTHYLRDKRGRDYFPMQITPSKEGKRVMTGSGSAGVDVCEENAAQSCRTITGAFHIYNKKGLECRSGEYPVDTKGGAKMPYCMYFYRGFTIHAAYEVPEHPSSHGCIRILPSAAKWLNEQFLQIGSKVIVLAYPKEANQSQTKPGNTQSRNI